MPPAGPATPDVSGAPDAPLAAPTGRLARVPALTVPVYRRFLAGAFVGNVGSWMQTTAQGWLVLGLTDSPGLLGLLSAVQTAPTLFFSLFAGVLADRVDRRKLIVVTQLLGALLAGVLAALTQAGVVAYVHVLALAFLMGTAQALATPSYQAIVSTLVPREAIGSAIALNSAQFNLSRVLGPSIAGAVIAAGGLALAFWGNALSFLAVALVLATLRLAPRPQLARAEASMWTNLLDGLTYVRRDRSVAVLVLLAGVPALFLLNYLILLPVFARDVLGVGAAGLGLLSAAIGVGALGGAVWLALVKPGGGNGRYMLVGLGVASIALVVFGLSTSLAVSVAALAVLGFCQVSYYATANTLIQTLVPGRLRGRVMSLYILTSWGLIPLGNLMAGLIAERSGAPLALAIGGTLTLIIAIVVAVFEPGIRGLEPGSRAAVGAPAAR